MDKSEKLIRNYEIDIVIPIYNSLDILKKCLEAVISNSDLPYRLILINDCSDVQTSKYLKKFSKENDEIIYIENGTNEGYVKSCNKGISLGTSPYVILLNSDALVPPDWLSRMILCADSDKKIGIVNPLSNEAANISVPIAPGCNYLGQDQRLSSLVPNYPDIVTAVGFCVLLKRKMLYEIGLFDEIYGRGYCEETDLCLRAIKANWRVVACDNLYVFHRGESSFTDKNTRFHKNLKIFMERHGLEYRKAYSEFIKNAPLKDLLAKTSESNYIFNKCFAITKRVVLDLLCMHPFKAKRHMFEMAHSSHFVKKPDKYIKFYRKNRPIIVFMFDRLDNFGGVISTLRIINILIHIGYEVLVTALGSGKGYIKGLFAAPLFFESTNSMINKMPYADIYISTAWQTAYWLPLVRNRYPNSIYVSYIQDYEAYFHPNSESINNKVLNSYSFPDFRITTSSWLQNLLDKKGFSSVVIPKGVDRDIFYPQKTIPRKKNSILAMGRPNTPYRGYDNILKIFKSVYKQNKQIEFGLFGTNDKIKHKFSFPVTIHGEVENGTSLAKLYSQYCVFIDASWFQGFGMMGLEAMSCETACVLTNIGGISQYIENDYNCYSASPYNIDAFTSKVVSLLNNDNKRNYFIQNGVETSKKFSLHNEAMLFSKHLNSWLCKMDLNL